MSWTSSSFADIFTIIVIIFAITVVVLGIVTYIHVYAFTEEEDIICDTAIGHEENYDYCDKLYDLEEYEKEVKEDEELHKEESKAWKENGWTKLK